MRNNLRLFIFLSFIFFTHIPQILLAQEKKDVTIERADMLEEMIINGQRIRKLTGDVVLTQDDILLECDSAYQFLSNRHLGAYGHVHVNQGDSIHAYGDSMTYDPFRRLAVIHHNARLEQGSMKLFTDRLYYDMNSRIATYNTGGRLTNDSTLLISKKGYYYAKTETAFFRDSVVLTDPSYSLNADTLEYNIPTDVAFFHGPTHIINKDNTVYCEKGFYDNLKNISVFSKNASLSNPPQHLRADSIFYQQKLGFGKAYRNVSFRDTAQNIIQFSEYAEYHDRTQRVMATGKSIVGYIIDQDTLFISGDTIRSAKEKDSDSKTLIAYNHVSIFKSDLQGICDSLFYSDSDSIIKMYRKPVMWTDSTQFSGDTLELEMKNGELKKINIIRNAYIANNPDTMVFNQISGRNIYGYLVNEELHHLEVQGNGRSIYFIQDEEEAYLGANKAECTDMKIYMNERKVIRIAFLNQPEGSFYPIRKVRLSDMILEGFEWMKSLQPRSKEDLLKKPTAPQGPPQTEKPQLNLIKGGEEDVGD